MILEEAITKVFITSTPTYVQSSLDTLYVCCNQSIKIFNLQDTTHEPEVLDTLTKVNSFELNKKKILVTSPNGNCALHDLTNGFTHSELKILIRSSLSLTDAVFTHGGSMVLCGGQEGKLKLIDIKEGREIQSIQLEKEIIGISYNNIVDVASIVLSDGSLIFYSFTSAEPERKASIPSIFADKTSLMLGSMGLDSDNSDDSDSDDDDASTSMFGDNESNMSNKKNLKKELKLTCSKPSWNLNGDLLAVPTKMKEILVYNINDLNKETYKFSGLKYHSKQVTDIKWSDDGKYIATVGLDNKIIIWDVNLRKSIASDLLPTTAFKIAWTSNESLVISSTKGEIINIDRAAFQSLLKSTSIEEEAEEDLAEEEEEAERNIQTEIQAEAEDEDEEGDDVNVESDEDEDALDRQIEQDDNQDGFIVDDDGSGYVTQKRSYDSMTSNSLSTTKKHKSNLKSATFLPHESNSFSLRTGWGAVLTKPYSIGSTPWENDRRYLSINSFGYIWSVKQKDHKSITISFFDKSLHKEYHFQDNNDLEICNMNENFVLFASTGFKKGNKGFDAKIVFKAHDQDDNKSWEREISLKPYEFITCVSISLNSCFVCTSKGFIRRYSLFGRLERMEKMSNIIAVMNSEKYVFTVNQRDQFGLYFNIQDLEGRYIQRGLTLPLEINKDGSIKSMFFSNDGDPCVVGQDDILLILTRWRDPLQASWIPILNLKDGVENLVNGEGIKCWPLGLIGDKFNFIPYKGRKYPFVPLLAPLEMNLRLPVSKSTMEIDVTNEDERESNNYDEDDLFGENTRKKIIKRDDPEEELMRYIVLAELLNESISNDDIEDENAEERLGELSLKYDTAILKQIGESCTNAKLQDAYYLATKLRDDKALVAASKIAERLDLVNLVIKLSKLREARMEED